MTDPCERNPGRIDELRAWAWQTGRTDIVFDLDLHASAWAFQDNPTRPNLARLPAILPSDHADGELAPPCAGRRSPAAGPATLAPLQAALQAWCPELCTRVTADLQEMAADHTWAEDGGPGCDGHRAPPGSD
jgi:hypothetical protein